MGGEREKLSGVRALGVNKAESHLVTGSRNGEVLIWDISSHPPKLSNNGNGMHGKNGTRGRFAGHRMSTAGNYYKPERLELYDEGDLKTGEILQVEIEESKGIVCDGNLTVFDVETMKTLGHCKRNKANYFGGVSRWEEERVLGLGWGEGEAE